MNKALVITTINPPTEAVIQFSRHKDFSIFVSGDNKTPKDWNYKNAEFISIQNQKKKYPRLSNLISENHYARKNFAYLDAIKSEIDFLYETDDDNFPYKFFPNFMNKPEILEQIEAPSCFNVYSLFTTKKVWPRGLPLNLINNPIKKKTKKKIKPLIQQSLADLDPDVDAIYRLTNGETIKFQRGKTIALSPGTFCPFNSQNTYWDKTVFPLLFLPSTIDSRVTDIWRGYIAQRVLWELDSSLIFISPSVYQERNIHNFMKDFEQELDLYLKTEKLVASLLSLSLKGNVSQMLFQVYSKLVKEEFFKPQELKALKEWLSFF